MAYKLRSKEGNTATFEITIDAKDFADAVNRAYNKQSGGIAIPGFRKGKAPKSVIENYYGKDVFFDDAVNEVLPKLYDEAVEGLELDPVDRPNVEIEDVSLENGAILKVEVDCKPEVKLGKYMGITIPKIDHTFTDEELNSELSFMQERNSRVVSADDKVLENGDIAVIDFEGFKDGVPFDGGKGENYSLELGSGSFIPGFEEQLIGKKNGETCEVNVVFPEEYHSADLAGAVATFTVKVNSIKTKEIPALDDEFAKDVSEFDTLEELKASLREKGKAESEARGRRETEDAVIDAILEDVEIDIPDAMVKDEISRIAQNMDHQLSHQGLNLEQYFQITGMTPEKFIEEYDERARNQVKANLVIEAICKAENIEATEEEIEAEYQKFLENSPGQEMEKIKEIVPADGLAHDIKIKKTLDLLIKNAKISKK